MGCRGIKVSTTYRAISVSGIHAVITMLSQYVDRNTIAILEVLASVSIFYNIRKKVNSV